MQVDIKVVDGQKEQTDPFEIAVQNFHTVITGACMEAGRTTIVREMDPEHQLKAVACGLLSVLMCMGNAALQPKSFQSYCQMLVAAIQHAAEESKAGRIP